MSSGQINHPNKREELLMSQLVSLAEISRRPNYPLLVGGRRFAKKVEQLVNRFSEILSEKLNQVVEIHWLGANFNVTSFVSEATKELAMTLWGEELVVLAPLWVIEEFTTSQFSPLVPAHPERKLAELVSEIGRGFQQKLDLSLAGEEETGSDLLEPLWFRILLSGRVTHLQLKLSQSAFNRLVLYLPPSNWRAFNLTLSEWCVRAVLCLEAPLSSLALRCGMRLRPSLAIKLGFVAPKYLPLESIISEQSSSLILKCTTKPGALLMHEIPKQNHRLDSLTAVELAISVEFAEVKLSLLDLLDLTSGSVLPFTVSTDAELQLRMGTDLIGKGRLVTVNGELRIEVIETLSSCFETTIPNKEPIDLKSATQHQAVTTNYPKNYLEEGT